MMRMLANIAGTLAVGAGWWALAFCLAVADDAITKARKALDAGSLPI